LDKERVGILLCLHQSKKPRDILDAGGADQIAVAENECVLGAIEENRPWSLSHRGAGPEL
jgi:hypothetical protein